MAINDLEDQQPGETPEVEAHEIDGEAIFNDLMAVMIRHGVSSFVCSYETASDCETGAHFSYHGSTSHSIGMCIRTLDRLRDM